MSSVQINLNRRELRSNDVTLLFHEYHEYLGHVRVCADIDQIVFSESRDDLLIRKIIDSLPPNPVVHDLGSGGHITQIEMRGNASRVYIGRNAAVSSRHAWVDIKQIVEFLWGHSFDDQIDWTLGRRKGGFRASS